MTPTPCPCRACHCHCHCYAPFGYGSVTAYSSLPLVPVLYRWRLCLSTFLRTVPRTCRDHAAMPTFTMLRVAHVASRYRILLPPCCSAFLHGLLRSRTTTSPRLRDALTCSPYTCAHYLTAASALPACHHYPHYPYPTSRCLYRVLVFCWLDRFTHLLARRAHAAPGLCDISRLPRLTWVTTTTSAGYLPGLRV